ncbi:uncharacterized protein LOC133867838 isoform X4 [Alnus glutinosa]|nr:uncharacterized protein LOC133867838 isoform X4 [Alnus glutinosa]XP_062160586.1 uncharacterized protein LOC133867838 isoform X4 [Alnus glutinosa]
MTGRFQCSDQLKYYFVMPEGPLVGRENAIEIVGIKTFWSKTGDEFRIRESGYSYGKATMYAYIKGKRVTNWCMAIYHVDPQGVLKCGSVELGLHQVELQWKAVYIFSKCLHLNIFNPVPQAALPPPPSALSGMHAFVPSADCLLRDFVYPVVRHERNLFPHPFVHQLHDRSELPVDIDEMRRRFQILDYRFCDKYYFVMLEGPPTGEKNAIKIGGTKVFWKKISKKHAIHDRFCRLGFGFYFGEAYGYGTMYAYIRGEREIGWYMVIYRVNLTRVRKCGPRELGLNQIESRWVAVKILPKDASMMVFNPAPLLGPAPPAPPGDELPPPPPSPPASTGNRRTRHHPLALSGNKRNRIKMTLQMLWSSRAVLGVLSRWI